MKTIQVENITIHVTPKKIKNVHLSVHPPNGEVRLSVPNGMTEEAIKGLIQSKIAWIMKKQARFLDQAPKPTIEYLTGEIHYLFGTSYTLNLIEANSKPRVELREGYIDIYIRPNSTKEKRERLLNEWYRGQLKAVIPSYILKWEQTMGLLVNEWRIKRMKTRWGTCNVRDKRIWINLELAKKPPRHLEYIIVHEMVHLLERSHNARFKAYMTKYLPEWPKLKSDLNSRV